MSFYLDGESGECSKKEQKINKMNKDHLHFEMEIKEN